MVIMRQLTEELLLLKVKSLLNSTIYGKMVDGYVMNKNHVNIIILLWASIFLSGCCWIDYTDEIKELAKPMQAKFYDFISANNRGPNPSEKEALLKEVNCNYIESYSEGREIYCSNKGKRFKVEFGFDTFFGVDEDNPPNSIGYGITIKYETSACRADIYSNGKPAEMLCYKSDCIQWSH